MIHLRYISILATFSLFIFSGCREGHDHGHNGHRHGDGHHGGEAEEVMLTQEQFDALQMKIDTLQLRNMSGYIEANGQLETAPENEALVTAIVAANIAEVKAVEGEKVQKGDVLAYLSHPDLIKLQTDYIGNYSRMQFLENDFKRQKRLYAKGVASGMSYQRSEADFQAVRGTVNGLRSQLRLLGINPSALLEGTIYERVPVCSPISGYLREIGVRNGQYVEPQTEMFGIMDIDHIHAVLMVFEKDISKVKENQEAVIKVTSAPDREYRSTVHVTGKAFENDLKAVRIHADVDNEDGSLLPGMYVTARILVEDKRSHAVPEGAIVREDDTFFVFTAKKENHNGKAGWVFEPVEVAIGAKDDGWMEVVPLNPLAEGEILAHNNAYYLMAELKKGEAGHSH